MVLQDVTKSVKGISETSTPWYPFSFESVIFFAISGLFSKKNKKQKKKKQTCGAALMSSGNECLS